MCFSAGLILSSRSSRASSISPGIGLTVGLDLPTRFPEAYTPEIHKAFASHRDSTTRARIIIEETASGLAVGLAVGLPARLELGLAWGLAAGLAEGPAEGLSVAAGYASGFLRIPFYPWHVFRSAFRADFYRNPYLNDAGIVLPLPGVRARLTTLAEEEPATAQRFMAFLLEYRPLQRQLAMHLTHAVAAGQWRQHVLDPDHLRPPEVVAEEPRLQPSEAWLAGLGAIAVELRSSELQSYIGLKKEGFERFWRGLGAFREQTLREPYRWHRYYLGAIDLWREEAQKKLAAIEREAERLEPMSPNVYRPSDALRPETDRDVFVGREDLRERLAREILTARSMPLLLIQGQRRVGKTSLLNFLPDLLGRRFLVVYQDLQSASASSVQKWMQDLRARVSERLGQAGDSWQAPEDWLDGWKELEEFLKGIAVPRGHKLILALDEYEKLHELLLQNSTQGGRLLGAMRSFSQHQNQVVFMFVGSDLFSELHDPDWGNYFVQTEPFSVDYLSRDETERLIIGPVLLRYAPEVIDRLYELTQGHPALLQLICRKLVDIANREGRGDLSLPDLDRALDEAIERETSVFTVFWNQFCRQRNCRETVERILIGEPPADRRALLQLQEHGYIVDKAGEWRMRVPLFETWLRRYKDAFA